MQTHIKYNKQRSGKMDGTVWSQWNTVINKALKQSNSAMFSAALKNFQQNYILPRIGSGAPLFNGQIDFNALKQSASQIKGGDRIFDMLRALGVAKDPSQYNVGIRSYIDSLKQSGKIPSGVSLTWDKDKGVMLGGQVLVPREELVIKDGHAYTTQEVIKKALSNFIKSQLGTPDWATQPNNEPGAGPGTEDQTTAQSGAPIKKALDNGTITPDLSKMSDVDLTYNMQKLTLNGQLKTYQDALKLVGDNESAMAQKITEVFNNLTQSALSGLEQTYNANKTALESEKGQVAAHYAGANQEIEDAIKTAKSRSKEEMAARGVYFSGLLTKATNTIEAKGIEEKAKVAAAKAADLNKIAAQIAVLTSNYNLGKNQIKNMYAAKKGLMLLDLMQKSNAQKQQIQLAMAGIQNQIDTLTKQKPYLEELGKRQEQAAQQQAQLEQEKYNNEMNLKYDQEKLAWAKFLSKQNLDVAKLNLQQEQFAKTLAEKQKEFGANYNLAAAKFNFDQWYKSALLGLKQMAANGSGQQKAAANDVMNTKLTDLINMNPSQLAKFIKSIESLKVKDGGIFADSNAKPYLPDNLKPLENMENFAVTLAKLTTDAGDLSDPKKKALFINDLKALAPSLQGQDIDNVISNYVQDPVAKIFAAIVLAAKGDMSKTYNIYMNNLDNFNAVMDKLGINDENHRQLLYQLFGWNVRH